MAKGSTVKLGIAQLNPTVGDLAGNRRLIEDAARRAAAAGCDLALFPELALPGYPPLDLLERDDFVRDQLRELAALEQLTAHLGDTALLLGAALPASGRGGKRLQNAALLLQGGERRAHQAKTLLPSYDVFDEKRYFIPAETVTPVELGALRLGMSVCEDAWVDAVGYPSDPITELSQAGAGLIANLSASPWHLGKPEARRRLFAELAAKHGVPIAFANQVGGNDELIFDGGSFVVDARGRLVKALPLFEPALEVITLDLETPGEGEEILPGDAEDIAQLAAALQLGIRDYFCKQKLPPRAVVGLSGGIDSAVTAWLAATALGPENVLGIAMPGPYSSKHSIEDAIALAEKLGIELRRADIRPVYESYRDIFATLFGAREDYGLAQQNIQSRIRGALLMAASNAEGRLVLATGNKSELSVGYCTLYGDTVGGLAVLGDVYKRDVYALARYANREREQIPRRSLDKAPSAELAPGQLDSDDLPEYAVLDAVLHQAIEGGLGAAEITPPEGASAAQAREIVRRLDRNEYKRRQAPLVLRVSEKAFGGGRRLPIAQRYAL